MQIIKFLMKKITLPIITGNQVVFLGDSITVGVGGSPRWTTILCNSRGWTETNAGISGSHIIKDSNHNSLPSWQDNFSSIPIKTENHRYLIISLGVNDVGLNYTIWSSSLFNTHYRLLISNAYSKGWTKDRIICVNIYYVNSPIVWSAYNSYGIDSLADEIRYQDFRSKITNMNDVATVLDPYQYFKDTIGNSGLSDNLHPNTVGYQVIGDFMITNLI